MSVEAIDAIAEAPQGYMVVRRERFFSAHHMMLHVARRSLYAARALNGSDSSEIMVVIVMCASAVEALANALGVRLIKQWSDFDKLTPYTKLRLSFAEMGVKIERGREPWQSVNWLARLRNDIVHGKAETVSELQRIDIFRWTPQKEVLLRLTDWPRSKLEGDLSLDSAERAVEAFDALLKEAVTRLPKEMWPGITGDQLDVTTTHEPPAERESDPAKETSTR